MIRISEFNLTQKQVLDLPYLDRPMGYYQTYYNVKTQQVTTLREFTSDEFAQQEAPFPDWVFKPYQDRAPKVNPELKDSLEEHMLELSRAEVNEGVVERLTYFGKDDFYTAEKSLQGAVTTSAVFLEKRDLSTPHILNGLICIESDEDYDKFRKAGIKFGHCCFIGRSRSYQGGWAVIPVTDPNNYDRHFAAAEAWFSSQGVKIDYLDDITRLRGYAWDPDRIINEQVRPYTQLAEVAKKKKKKTRDALKSHGQTTMYDRPGFVEYVHQKAVQACGPFTGSLNPYLQQYAAYFRNYGINWDYAAEYLWNKYWQYHPIIRATKDYDQKGFFYRFGGPYRGYPEQFYTWRFQTIWVEQFATEAIEAIADTIIRNHRDGYATNLVGATGIAKTTLIYAIEKRRKDEGQKGGLVAAFPTNLAAEQKASEFSFPENNPIGADFDIVEFNQYTDKTIVDHLPQFRVVNIPHAKCEKMTYLTDEHIYFFDELHKAFIDDFDNTDRNFQAWYESKAIRIAGTGTPMEGSSKELRIRDLFIKRMKNPVVNLFTSEVIDSEKHSINDCLENGRKHSYNFEQTSTLMFNACTQFIDQLGDDEKGKLNICYINNTKQIEKLKEMFSPQYEIKELENDEAKKLDLPYLLNAEPIERLKKELLLSSKYNIMVLYSDEKIKEGKLWKGINDLSFVPTDEGKINVLICTSVAYESIGIKNENLTNIAVFGERWPHNIEQIIGRPRKVDVINAYWFLPSRRSRGYFKGLEHYMADQELVYTKAKKALNLLKEVNEFSQYHTGLDPDRIIKDSSVLFNPDGSFNKFRAVKQYFRDKNDFESNRQKFDYFTGKQNFNTQDFGTIAVGEEQRVCNAIKDIKKQKEDEQGQAFKLLRENLTFCMLLVLRSRIPAELRSNIKDLLSQEEKALLWDEQFNRWRDQVPREVATPITSAISKYVYLAKIFLRDDKFLDIIEENFKTFGKIKKQIEILLLLENSSQSAAHIYSRDKYRRILQSFKQGQDYTSSDVHQVISRIYQNDKIVRLTKTKSMQLFNLLFHTTKQKRKVDGKWQRKYRVGNPKTVKSVAEVYGLSASQSSTVLQKYYTYCKSVLNLESVQDIDPNISKVQNSDIVKNDPLSSAISAIENIKKMKL